VTKSNIGLIGLGTMGAMLALNIAEKGFGISVFNRTTATMKSFFDNAGELAAKITPCETLEALITTILFSKQWSISFANCLKACPPENDSLKTEPSLPASVVIQVQHKLVVSGEVSLNSTPVSSPNSVIHHT